MSGLEPPTPPDPTKNGRLVFILLLAAFWCYLAWTAWANGSTQRALIYLGLGAALTIYRVSRMRSTP